MVDLLKKGLTDKEKIECAANFGKMMAEELLDVMEGRSCEVHTQTFKGKEEAIMAELMKRQWEVQG